MIIYILSFAIPLLSPFAITSFLSFADPFIIARDIYMDTNPRLKTIYGQLVSVLGILILWTIFKKDLVALVSLITSLISESTDYFITRRFANTLTKKMIITLSCNILDIIIFSTLAIKLGAVKQLDFNIIPNALFLSFIYVLLMVGRQLSINRKENIFH